LDFFELRIEPARNAETDGNVSGSPGEAEYEAEYLSGKYRLREERHSPREYLLRRRSPE
jgi:hypothetical protein